MADKAHLYLMRDIINTDDYAMNTVIEEDLIAKIDDDMTYIKSVRESKSSLPRFDGPDDDDDRRHRSRRSRRDRRGDSDDSDSREDREDRRDRVDRRDKRDDGGDTFLGFSSDFSKDSHETRRRRRRDDDSDDSGYSDYSLDSDIYGDPLSGLKLDPRVTKNNRRARDIFRRSGHGYSYEAADTFYGYEEDKAEYIDNINRMRVSLKEQGINIDDIPTVDASTSASIVNRVYKQITRRYDSATYSDTGSDIIVGLCQCLEGIFNGKRVLFGIRPDLTGWTDQYVRPHMTHFRYETSKMVAEYIEQFGFGRFAKILLLLIPGALVYMATGRNISGQKNTDYGRAMNNLGNDEPAQKR
jgi:hypothetical protein